jgi:hypothetical protein
VPSGALSGEVLVQQFATVRSSPSGAPSAVASVKSSAPGLAIRLAFSAGATWSAAGQGAV